MNSRTGEAIDRHIAEHTKGKHGKHEYDLASYALSKEMVEARYAFYVNDHRWPIDKPLNRVDES